MTNESAEALKGQSLEAMKRGDANGALALLERAAALDAQDPEIPLNIALAHRLMGDYEKALMAIEAALARDPYSFMALLSKGALLERLGRNKEAARVYKDALGIAPAPERRTPQIAAPLARAEQVVKQNADALAAFLRTRTQDVRNAAGAADLTRAEECLAILAGQKKAYQQEPSLLHFPKLPPLTFYPRDHFGWLERLETATPVIKGELEAALAQDQEKFHPYIQYGPGAPLAQWSELNNSRAWSTMHLWRDGKRFDENCARCPQTAALVESLPLAVQPGYGPTVMFSALAPHTTIPPHTGSSNTRLICHLALIVPPKCRFRVGNDVREWREGEAFVFDDTIEHEAWNDSDQVRAVLIIDVWNPFLTEAERAMVCAMGKALQDYYAQA